jgi:hypothetical protein
MHVRTNQIFLALFAFGCAPLLKEGNPRMTLKIGSAASSDRALGTGINFSTDYCYALHIQGPGLNRVPPSAQEQACANGPKGLGVVMGLYDVGATVPIEVTVGQRKLDLVGVKKSDIAGVDLTTCEGNVLGANILPPSPGSNNGPNVQMTINGAPVERPNSSGTTSGGDDDDVGDVSMMVFASANVMLLPGENNVAMQAINGGAGAEYKCRNNSNSNNNGNGSTANQGPWVFPWPDGMCQPGTNCTIKSGMDRANLPFTALCSNDQSVRLSIFNSSGDPAPNSPISAGCVLGRANIPAPMSHIFYASVFAVASTDYLNMKFEVLDSSSQVVKTIEPKFYALSNYVPLTKLDNGTVPANGADLLGNTYLQTTDPIVANPTTPEMYPRILGQTTIGADQHLFIQHFTNTGGTAPRISRFQLAHSAAGSFKEFVWDNTVSLPQGFSERASPEAGVTTQYFLSPSYGPSYFWGLSSYINTWRRLNPLNLGLTPTDASTAFPANVTVSTGEVGSFRDFAVHARYISPLKLLINNSADSVTPNFSDVPVSSDWGSVQSNGNLNAYFRPNSSADPIVYISLNQSAKTNIFSCQRSFCTVASNINGIQIGQAHSGSKARTAFYSVGNIDYETTVGLDNSEAFVVGHRLKLTGSGYFSSITASPTAVLNNSSPPDFVTNPNFFPNWVSTPVVTKVAALQDTESSIDGIPHLVAVGSATIGSWQRAVIYRSRDGGLNWYRVYLGGEGTRILDAHSVKLSHYYDNQEHLKSGFAFLEGQTCGAASTSSCSGGFKIIHQTNHGF